MNELPRGNQLCEFLYRTGSSADAKIAGYIIREAGVPVAIVSTGREQAGGNFYVPWPQVMQVRPLQS